MPGEARMQGIRRQLESLIQTIQRQVPGRDAVVARQDLLDDGARTRLELPAKG